MAQLCLDLDGRNQLSCVFLPFEENRSVVVGTTDAAETCTWWGIAAFTISCRVCRRWRVCLRLLAESDELDALFLKTASRFSSKLSEGIRVGSHCSLIFVQAMQALRSCRARVTDA